MHTYTGGDMNWLERLEELRREQNPHRYAPERPFLQPLPQPPLMPLPQDEPEEAPPRVIEIEL
jgi:hypothetical protein